EGVQARQNRCRALSVQEAAQRLASVMLGLLSNAGIRYPIEAVIRPRIYMKLDRHPSATQSIRISHVFFQEKIKTADRNVGWRQAPTQGRLVQRPNRGRCGLTPVFAQAANGSRIICPPASKRTRQRKDAGFCALPGGRRSWDR